MNVLTVLRPARKILITAAATAVAVSCLVSANTSTSAAGHHGDNTTQAATKEWKSHSTNNVVFAATKEWKVAPRATKEW